MRRWSDGAMKKSVKFSPEVQERPCAWSSGCWSNVRGPAASATYRTPTVNARAFPVAAVAGGRTVKLSDRFDRKLPLPVGSRRSRFGHQETFDSAPVSGRWTSRPNPSRRSPRTKPDAQQWRRRSDRSVAGNLRTRRSHPNASRAPRLTGLQSTGRARRSPVRPGPIQFADRRLRAPWRIRVATGPQLHRPWRRPTADPGAACSRAS